MAYADASQPLFDPERAAQYRAEVDRSDSLVLCDAASLYLDKVRGIASAVFMPCSDLRVLSPPIPGRPPTDWACVSILRPLPNAAATGAELVFVDVLGNPAATEPRRMQWAFVEHGCRDAWFWAGGSGARAYVAEGFLTKPLAILSTGLPGLVMGWGARPWLRFKRLPPTVRELVVCPDRRPDDPAQAAAHDRDYQRGIDHWLLEFGA
jgi:hypothetical protein